MTSDTQELLASFVRTGSEPAFREIVSRYIDLVYSTAVRLVDGDTHRAQDVAQVVFADLARMAAKLSERTMLGGWLHRHTCFVARTVMRGERRRQARERLAMELHALNDPTGTALAQLAPVLDEAIQELGPDDRDVILLRFFERRNLRAVGDALGINENVAQKRVARAVQELGVLLQRRGVAFSAAALASALAAGAVTAAPAGLALGIAASVFPAAGATAGAGVATAKVALVSNLKAGIAGALIVAGLVTGLLVKNHSKAPRRSEAIPDPSQPEQVAVAEPEVAPVAPEPPIVVTTTPPSPARVAPQRTPTSVAIPVSRPEQTVAVAPTQAVVAPLLLGGQVFNARAGSKVRIEGTANIIHPTWQIESPLIGGTLEVGPDFPTQPGRVEARAEAFIQVRSLKSVKEDGSPYSDRMDEVMCETLRERHYPKITYHLTELSYVAVTNRNNVPEYVFDSSGDLTIAGVTNELTMPVRIQPLADGKVIILGQTVLKMTSFGIQPVDQNLVVGHIKVGDEVRVKFLWIVGLRKGAASPSNQSRMPTKKTSELMSILLSA